MTMMEQKEPLDPAVLAASVREIALRARQILKHPATRLFELRALSRRIAFLQLQAPGGKSSELSRWLESLYRKVKACEDSECLARHESALPSTVAVG
jgi:hypothetical protein